MSNEKVVAIHESSLVWDNHTCMPIRADDSFIHELARHHKSGVNVAILNIGYGDTSLDTQIKVVAYMRHWLGQRPKQYKLIGTTEDINEAKKTNRLAVAFNIEGANSIGDQLSLVKLFYDLGVRWMLLAYNKNNIFAGGCHDEDQGLTKKGYALIDEMKKVGMVVCCSHMGHKSAMDVLDYSSNPVIFSHSNMAGLVNHPRNINDMLVRACARSNGVIGVNGVGIFLGDPQVNIELMVDHIDHIVQLVGPEHAGIALDYVFDKQELDDALSNSKNIFPPGYDYENGTTIIEPEQFPKITEALLKRNYSDIHIRWILGENFLRVAKTVWR